MSIERSEQEAERGCCPVCLLAAPDAVTCPTCEWTLTSGYLLGHATVGQQRKFAERLSVARRGTDLRAAVRAAGFPAGGDQAELDRLLDGVRGGRPSPQELIEARSAVAAELPTTLEQVLLAEALTPAVERLADALDRRAGAVDRRASARLSIVEIRADGLTSAELTADELGTPCLVEQPGTTRWADLLPGLPRDPATGRFALAGGVGMATWDSQRLQDQLEQLAARSDVLPQPRDERHHEVVLLVRVPGWSLVELLLRRHRELGSGAGSLRSEIRLPPDGALLTDRGLAGLRALAPLRRDLGLVLAVVNRRSGAVRLQPHTLFPAGAKAATAGSATVPVLAPATGGAALVLAVVVGTAGVDLARWRPVAISRVRLQAGLEHRIEVVLESPGQVRFRQPADVVADDDTADPGRVALEQRWAALLGGVPQHCRHRGESFPIDVVFALELAGAEAAVRCRLSLVNDIIELIGKRHPSPVAVRVAVLGYADHGDRSRARQVVVTGSPLAPVAQCLSALARFEPRVLVHSHAAPVEDALFEANRLAWRDDPCARVLVVLGSRPAHPLDDGVAPRCPNRRNWGELLETLRSRSVRTVAVWDPPDWARRASPDRYKSAARIFWSAIAGGDAPARQARTTAGALTEIVMPLPSPGPEDVLLFPITTTPTTVTPVTGRFDKESAE